jgi:hypothetical protein
LLVNFRAEVEADLTVDFEVDLEVEVLDLALHVEEVY